MANEIKYLVVGSVPVYEISEEMTRRDLHDILNNKMTLLTCNGNTFLTIQYTNDVTGWTYLMMYDVSEYDGEYIEYDESWETLFYPEEIEDIATLDHVLDLCEN